MVYSLLYINNLIKQFLCCTPIKILDTIITEENIACFMNIDTQNEVLKKTVNSDLIGKYPIKQSYQRAFLKWFMNKIEKGGGEVHDGIYTTYCRLISLKLDESIHYRHFLIGNFEELDCISLQENVNIISEGTTGLCSWQGAVELNKWCIENEKELHRKVILELGCGVGLTGLCVIRKCLPKQYIFTDCHRTVLERVSKNIKLNLLNDKATMDFKQPSNNGRLKDQIKYNNTDVKIIDLKWEDINEYITEGWIIPDIIIGADILYDADSFPALVSGLKAFLSSNKKYAIIAGMIRNVNTISQFLQQLEAHNLSYQECVTQGPDMHVQLIPVKILKIFKNT